MIYGNGSAGPFVAVNGSNFSSPNLQFTDFSVPTGVVLSTPSGTIVRATGAVSIAGELLVGTFARSGASEYGVEAHPGVSCRAAADGAVGPPTMYLAGGAGGVGMANPLLVIFGAEGGGGGCGHGGVRGFNSGAGHGGGTIRILAQGQITISGIIFADGGRGSGGDVGGGGGGGGIIIIASATKIIITGAITARGGDGDNSRTLYNAGAGGGGGGGLVHLLAPEIVYAGSVSVIGGVAGSSSENAGPGDRHAGGGGGGSFGSGGAGGDIPVSGDTADAQAGEAGLFLQTLVDPTSLFS